MEQRFKDGDILFCRCEYEWIFIYREGGYKTESYISLDLNEKELHCSGHVLEDEDIKELRHATEYEKQQMLEALKASDTMVAKLCLEMLLRKSADKTDHKNDRKDNKPRWELLPLEVIEEAVKVYTFGAEKYEANSWQRLENGKERYYAALMRHLVAWRKGEKVDEESGLSTLAHVLWNSIALLWFEMNDGKNDGKIQNTEG